MKKRVFVLDDDFNECMLVKAVLTRAGYDVDVQSEPNGAMSSIKNVRPDLVMLDVRMPGLGGDTLASIIQGDKSMLRKPKIVFFSNLSEAELKALAEKNGATGYHCKTNGPIAMVEAVKKALAEA